MDHRLGYLGKPELAIYPARGAIGDALQRTSTPGVALPGFSLRLLPVIKPVVRSAVSLPFWPAST